MSGAEAHSDGKREGGERHRIRGTQTMSELKRCDRTRLMSLFATGDSRDSGRDSQKTAGGM